MYMYDRQRTPSSMSWLCTWAMSRSICSSKARAVGPAARLLVPRHCNQNVVSVDAEVMCFNVRAGAAVVV